MASGRYTSASSRLRSARVSQSQIANRLGLSRQVVSAILNGGEQSTTRYSPQTARDVLALAAELGYALQPQRAILQEIQVVAAGSLSMLSDQLLASLAHRCRAGNIDLSIDVVPSGSRPRLDLVDPDPGRVVLGFPSNENDCALSDLEAGGHAVLAVNAPTATVPRLVYDEAAGIAQVLRWLRESGRCCPAFFHPFDTTYSRLRCAAWEQEAAAQGFAAAPILCHGAAGMVVAMMEFLQLHPRIDAVLIEHPMMMMSLMEALNFLGRAVPDQVQPCTFFYADYLRGICEKGVCLDIRVGSLATHLVERCQAWCDGSRPPAEQRWPYHLQSVFSFQRD